MEDVEVDSEVLDVRLEEEVVARSLVVVADIDGMVNTSPSLNVVV